MPVRTRAWLAIASLAVATNAPAEQLSDVLEPDIVVTAPRTEGPLEVVTDPRLPRQPVPAHDGADYLKTIPGFSVIRKGGTDGDPLFRGMAGSRLNVLSEDAMLLGGCGARMDPPTAYVFPQNFDRIRVLKGPQSVLWGAGGSAATVLFERDPFDSRTDSNRLDVSALAGRWGRRDLAVDGIYGGESGYLRVQGSDARQQDYDNGDGDDVHSAYHRWNAQAMMGWTPVESTLVEFTAARSDGEAAYADRLMDGVLFDREAYSVRLRQEDLTDVVTLADVQVAWGRVDHVMDNYSLRDFVPTMMMPGRSVSNPDRETLGARIAFTLEPLDTLEIVVGVDGHDDRHRVRSSMNQGMVRYQALPRVEDARFGQRGVFGEFEWQMAPGRTVSWGARLDRWEVEDERRVIRQGMMMIMPNATADEVEKTWLQSGFLRYEHDLAQAADAGSADVVLFAGLGYAERTADYWERFGNDKQSASSNSAFFTDPERTTQLDVGLIRRTERARFSASLFAARIDDYILIDTRPQGRPAGTVVTRNVDASTLGGELEFALGLSEAWLLESSLMYTHGHNRSDNRALAQMPPLEGRIALTWTADRASVGGLVRGVASQGRTDVGRGNIVGQDVDETGGFVILSLNGSFRFSERLRLSAGVDNLLDRGYAEHLSRAGAMVAGYVQTDRIDEPGRTLWIKLDAQL